VRGLVCPSCVWPAQVSTSNNVVRLVSLADRERRWALRGVSAVLADHQNSHTINDSGASKGSSNNSSNSSGPRLCLLAAEPPQVSSAMSTSSALAAAIGPADDDSSLTSRSCRLVVNGHPGALQWFDALYDKVNDVALDVVPHNFNVAAHHLLGDNNSHRHHSNGPQQDAFPVPRVFLAGFGGGGQLLVTVDGWTPLSSLSSLDHQGAGGEGAGDGSSSSSKRARKANVATAIVRNRFSAQAPVETTTRPNLKFWTKASHSNHSSSNTSGSSSGGWRLNSTLGSPHGASAVTALACHPSPAHGMAATGAADGSLKVWRLQTRAEAAAASAANAIGGAKHTGERPSRANNAAAAAAANAAQGEGNHNNHNSDNGPGGGGPSSFWVCAASGGWRDGASVTSLALSLDGSVLAAGHACAPTATMARAAGTNNNISSSGGGGYGGSAGAGLVTLWDPTAELVLLATLVLPGSAQPPLTNPPCNMADGGSGGSAPHLLAFLSPGNEDAHARTAATAAAAAATKAGGGGGAASSNSGVVVVAQSPPTTTSAATSSSGATKLAVCRSAGVGVWDLATLRCDWHLGVACDAAAVLPTGARPFVVCAPGAPSDNGGGGGAASGEAPVRVATLAVAVRGTFDDSDNKHKKKKKSSSKEEEKDEGEKARPLRTCVALFGCTSSVPAYVFDLGLNFGAVASIQVL